MGCFVDYSIVLFIISFYHYFETKRSELRCYPIAEYSGKMKCAVWSSFLLNLMDSRDRLVEKFTT